MEIYFINGLIITNVILAYVIKELWKSNKKKDDVIRLQENILKAHNIIEAY